MTTTTTKRPRGRPPLPASTRRGGQGRSKVAITVEVPPELLAYVDNLARAKRWTRTALVIEALERMLEHK